MANLYIDNKYYDMGEAYHHTHSSPCYQERLEAMRQASKENELIIFTDKAMKRFLEQITPEEKPSISKVEVIPPTSFSIYGGGFHMWESHFHPYWHIKQVYVFCITQPLTTVCQKLNKEIYSISQVIES